MHVIRTLRFSGADMVTLNLAKYHQSKGHPTAICSLSPPEADFAETVELVGREGVVFSFPDRSLSLDRFPSLIRRAVQEFNPDIVVGQCVTASLFSTYALRSNTKLKIVTALHDGTSDDYRDPIRRLAGRLQTRRDDAVITVNSLQIINYRRRIAQHKRLRVIENGVEVTALKEATEVRNDSRRRFGLADDDVLILQTGRIFPIKGQLRTVEALLRVANPHHNIEVWFAGLIEQRNYVKRIETLARKLPDNIRIRMLGGRSDVPELLAASDIFAMPSSREAHSLSFLEALVSGSHIVASNITAFEFARNMSGVELVDTADAPSYAQVLEKVINNHPRVTRDIELYSLRRQADRYMELFEELTSTT